MYTYAKNIADCTKSLGARGVFEAEMCSGILPIEVGSRAFVSNTHKQITTLILNAGPHSQTVVEVDKHFVVWDKFPYLEGSGYEHLNSQGLATPGYTYATGMSG